MSGPGMLNENQHRALSAALRTVEENLHEIAQSLECGEYSGALYDLKNDIIIANREPLLIKLNYVREKLKVIADEFGLYRAAREISRQGTAKLAYCRDVLIDSRSGPLKRYGDVADGLDRLLDPQIEMLITLMTEIQTLINESEPKNRITKED
jgi:hypothetical protein